MEGDSLLGLAGFAVACLVAGSSGAIFRPGEWYERLNKPSWRPPNWLFGPVWMVLYAMIAISGWLVWLEAGWSGAALGLGLYAVQLVLNGLWSGIFFGLRRIGLACAEMALLWASILATIVVFYPVDALAALLLLPYLVWVTFALALNAAVLRLNREAVLPEAETGKP